VKYVLSLFLPVCVIGLALNCQVAQASGSRIVLAAIGATPARVCSAPAAQPFAMSFPAMAPAEKNLPFASDDGGFPEYPQDGAGFACFAGEPAGPGTGNANEAHRDQWLASTRLLPSYPLAGNPVFLPFGWHWIDFDR